MAKPKKIYVAKYTGNHWNTREEAVRDNAKWLRDPLNRFTAKSKAYPTYKDFTIPFIECDDIVSASMFVFCVLPADVVSIELVDCELWTLF